MLLLSFVGRQKELRFLIKGEHKYFVREIPGYGLPSDLVILIFPAPGGKRGVDFVARLKFFQELPSYQKKSSVRWVIAPSRCLIYPDVQNSMLPGIRLTPAIPPVSEAFPSGAISPLCQLPPSYQKPCLTEP